MIYRQTDFIYSHIAEKINKWLEMSGVEIYTELGAGVGETFYSQLAGFSDGKIMVVELINSGDTAYAQAFLYDKNYYEKRVELSRSEEYFEFFREWEIEYGENIYRLNIPEVVDIELNKDVKRRDEIIFGKYEPDKYSGGIRGFENLNLEKLEMLIEEKFAKPFEKQNDCPTIEEIYNFIKKHSGYTAHGYAVSIDRPDYRVSLEGVYKNGTAESETELLEFKTLFGTADDFETENEMYCWFD